MEAEIKKELIFVEDKSAKEVADLFPVEGKRAIIDFSASLVVFPNSGIVYKRFKGDDYQKAWEQLKRWISASSFDEVLVLDGFDFLPVSLISEWLNDHKSKEGFPKLIISGKNIDSEIKKIANKVI